MQRAASSCDIALHVAQRELRFAGRDGTGIKVTVSLGVAACSGDAVSYEEAIKRADTMLYKAKESGRNRVETWDCAVLAKAS